MFFYRYFAFWRFQRKKRNSVLKKKKKKNVQIYQESKRCIKKKTSCNYRICAMPRSSTRWRRTHKNLRWDSLNLYYYLFSAARVFSQMWNNRLTDPPQLSQAADTTTLYVYTHIKTANDENRISFLFQEDYTERPRVKRIKERKNAFRHY